MTIVSLFLCSLLWGNQAHASPQDMDEAADLYQQGRAKFDTYDYEGAIVLWTQAYSKLKDSEETRVIRADLVHNIATARVEAYKLDGKIRHLELARLLLRKYIKEVAEIEGTSFEGAAELARNEKKLAEIDEILFAQDPVEPAAKPATRSSAKPARRSRRGPYDEPLPPGSAAEPDSPRRPLRIAGASTMAAGGVMGIVAITGMALGNKAEDDYVASGADLDAVDSQGKRMNGIAIGAGITAVILTGVATALLVVDSRKHKNRKVSWTGTQLLF